MEAFQAELHSSLLIICQESNKIRAKQKEKGVDIWLIRHLQQLI